MAYHAQQQDLFDEPKTSWQETRPLRPPYTLAELTELDRQLRNFARVPDEWCPGWAEMHQRALDTLKQVSKEERAAFRAVFFEEVDRLIQVDIEEVRAAKAAEAAARAAEAKPRRQASRRR